MNRFLVLVSLILSIRLTAAPLEKIENCKLIATTWADGDSFQIQTPAGKSHTVRLYGVDCVEWHVSDKSDATRLAAQRRYFGVADYGGSPLASIAFAKDMGKAAAAETARILSNPFTIHTSFADARGDGSHQRIYALITTATGKDLAELLVRAGLARAFGVYRETPAGISAKEYKETLRDVELVASKTGSGIWQKTNWDQLTIERQKQRTEDAELELATAKPKANAGFKLNPNTAARDELMKLPGIGEITANRIIERRPFSKPADLLKVPGIGATRLKAILPHLEISARR
jgi:competence protein ComEA